MVPLQRSETSAASPLIETHYTPMQLFVGVHEFGTRKVFGAALTELNATALWMYMHIGIVRAATSGAFGSPALAAGVAHFVLIALLTYAFAAPSGAHFNPNITLATVMVGHTTLYRYVLYAVAQMVGAVLGTSAMRLTLGWDSVTSASEMAGCSIGHMSPAGAVMANSMLFHLLCCVIGGIAFDARQAAAFGPVLAPIFIAASIGLIMFATSALAEGFGPALNVAECVSIGIVSGEWTGLEWISFVGPTIGGLVHATLYLAVPPSHAKDSPASGEQSHAPLLVPFMARK